MTREEIRACQVEILERVASFCREHDLTWYLWAGSLLGAVRHQGFIPWDDDIDLAMPRPDFERFCREFDAAETGALRLYSRDTHPTFGYPFVRVADERTRIAENSRIAVPMGINVDVFPLDGWPRGKALTALHRGRLHLLHRLVALWTSRPRQRPGRRLKNLVIRISRPALDRIRVRSLTGRITRVAKARPYDGAEHVGVTVFRYLERVERGAYGEPQEIEFEGRSFRAGPADHDAILRRLYGDYMRVPTEAERSARYTHFHAAYRRDDTGVADE
jgi:lipopolysaccharide cholinephosphotransferase